MHTWPVKGSDDGATEQAPPNFDIRRVDDLGWTDAHHIAFASYPLRNAKANVWRDFLEKSPSEYLCKQNTYGQTPLHLAVRENFLEIVDFYLRRRPLLPCLETANRDGDTPLHYAAAWGRLAIAARLLEGGVDPMVRNANGDTPADDAKSHHFPVIASMLEEATNKPHVHHGAQSSCWWMKYTPPALVLLMILAFETARQFR